VAGNIVRGEKLAHVFDLVTMTDRDDQWGAVAAGPSFLRQSGFGPGDRDQPIESAALDTSGNFQASQAQTGSRLPSRD